MSPTDHHPPEDPTVRAFLQALEDLDHALDLNVDRAARMKERISDLRTAIAAGSSVVATVPGEEPPLIVRLLSDSAETLQECGSRVRRTEAAVLHEQGMTMDQIAKLFGVTRQRVSALLRESPPRNGQGGR
jgi:DNA-directed RNA polymerase sigma subunit (sigma70/sigma32)